MGIHNDDAFTLIGVMQNNEFISGKTTTYEQTPNSNIGIYIYDKTCVGMSKKWPARSKVR